MGKWYDKVQEAYNFIIQNTSLKPDVGIILGTGLGELAEKIEKINTIPYEEIPHFPVSTVESHKGTLIFGHLGGKNVVAMQGRFHYYEGYSMKEVTFPVRVMKLLGIKVLLVSNACGGMNPLFRRGDLMIIADHINFFPESPLRGENEEKFGPRFPDMYNTYTPELTKLAEDIALREGISVRKGIYLGIQGPAIETAAEYRMLRAMGADAVGMSTVPEVLVAKHMDIKVLGISVITDIGLPDAMRPLSLEDVIESAGKAEPKLTKLMEKVVEEIKI